MVISPSNDQPATTESNIRQVQSQSFTRPKASVKHKTHKGDVTRAPKLGEQLIYMVGQHWPR
jgi:hypothetical protein